MQSYTNTFERAQSIAKKMDVTPSFSLFYTCIRNIKNAESQGADTSTVAIKNGMQIVSISPTLKAAFYAAAQIYHKESLERCTDLNLKNLMKMFSPSEITAIIALIYLTKKIKKKCTTQDENDEWARTINRMITNMEITALVGDTIEYIGIGNGLLIGGLRNLASFLFCLIDMKAYKQYRRDAANKKKIWDLKEEEKIFGCNHLQIASYLSQTLGFGLGTVQGLVLAFEDEEKAAEAANSPQLATQILCWRAAIRWSESLHVTGSMPESVSQSESDEMYLPPEQQDKLIEKVTQLRANENPDLWIFRSFDELPAEVKEKLAHPNDKNSNSKESPEAELA